MAVRLAPHGARGAPWRASTRAGGSIRRQASGKRFMGAGADGRVGRPLVVGSIQRAGQPFMFPPHDPWPTPSPSTSPRACRSVRARRSPGRLGADLARRGALLPGRLGPGGREKVDERPHPGRELARRRINRPDGDVVLERIPLQHLDEPPGRELEITVPLRLDGDPEPNTRRRSSKPTSIAGCSAWASRGCGARAATRAVWSRSAARDVDSARHTSAGACAPRRRT
jgi:hypothetical protein